MLVGFIIKVTGTMAEPVLLSLTDFQPSRMPIPFSLSETEK